MGNVFLHFNLNIVFKEHPTLKGEYLNSLNVFLKVTKHILGDTVWQRCWPRTDSSCSPEERCQFSAITETGGGVTVVTASANTQTCMC